MALYKGKCNRGMVVMAEKWKWLGIEAVTDRTALKKLKKHNIVCESASQDSPSQVTEKDKSSRSMTISTSRKKTHIHRNNADYRYYTKKRKSSRHGTSYYERFRIAPSAYGIKFYGTKTKKVKSQYPHFV